MALRAMKTFLKMKEYVGIYIKTEKAQEQDGFGNKVKYHFQITTVHKYRLFAFCLYSIHIYLCRVVMWKWRLMWKWYLILLPKPSCACAFSVLVYIPTYSFIFLNVFYYSCFDSIFFFFFDQIRDDYSVSFTALIFFTGIVSRRQYSKFTAML